LGSTYQGKPIVWACYNNRCFGTNPLNNNQPVTMADCNFLWVGGVRQNNSPDPVSQVKVVCGGTGTPFPVATGVGQVNGCPALAGPPSSIFTLDPPGTVASGSFQAVASLQIGSGGTKELCRATVPFAGTEPAADILNRVVDRINAQPSCTSQGVKASPKNPQSTAKEEDDFRIPGIVIQDPNVTAGELFLTANAPPGQTTGLLFNANGLGVPASGALAITRVAFSTASGGAQGGSVTMIEASPIGTCKYTIATNSGDSPATIASAVAAAFQSAVAPGTNDCPSNANPLDVVSDGDSVVTVLPSSLTVGSNDPGVGFAVGPEELLLKSCTPLPSIYGSNSALVGDGAVINRAGGGSGSVAGGGSGGVTLAPDTVVGDILSVGSVTVGTRGRVNGIIEAGGTITLGSQTNVAGPVLHATPNLPTPQVLPSTFPPPTGDVAVGPGNTLTLAPGSYGNVAVRPRATVNLAAGTYYIRSLDLEAQSTAHLDTTAGAVLLYVHDSIIFLGAFVDPLHTKSNLFIGFTGTSTVALEAPLEASVVAPSAKLVLGPAPSPGFSGEFFAKDIQVQPGVTVSGQSFDCPSL
jgi:hypothetical protein